jgi:hypothetical protein
MANINATLLKTLRSEIETALANVGQKHGVKFHVGKGHYNPSGLEGDLKLEIASIVNGQAVNPQETAFKLYARRYGLEESDLGKTFRFRSDSIKITGLEPKRQKFTIVGQNLRTGKINLYYAPDVVRGLNAPKPLFASVPVSAPPLPDNGASLEPRIVLLTNTNPYKMGTKAHATFELMRRWSVVSEFKKMVAASPIEYDPSYLSWAAKPHGNQPAYIKVV